MAADEANGGRLAAALLGNALRLKRGENLIVETWSHSLAYATACVIEARRNGAHPILLLEDETAYWRSVDVAPQVQRWSGVGQHEWAALDRADAYVFFPGPGDRRRLRSLPTAARDALVGYNDEWYRRARRARVRAVRSLLGYASDSQALHWGVNGPLWRSQLIRGTVEVDYPQLVADAQRLVQRLRTAKSLRITGANGSDLTVRLRGRSPWSDDGVVGADDLKAGRNMANAPPGSVVVAVDEKSAEGLVVGNRPSFLGEGRVEGGQWELKSGRLTSHWYTDGQATFDAAFEAAPKGKDALSFLSVGLNPALGAGVAQVEDQEAGAVTLGIGGNTYYGGSNRCPWVSWVVLGEASIAADGKPLLDRGKVL